MIKDVLIEDVLIEDVLVEDVLVEDVLIEDVLIDSIVTYQSLEALYIRLSSSSHGGRGGAGFDMLTVIRFVIPRVSSFPSLTLMAMS